MFRQAMTPKQDGRWAVLLSAVLWMLAGCGSTKAAKGTGGSGEAIAQGQCQPGEDSETCCIKTFPGQYERCGLKPPPLPRNRPNPLLPRIPTPTEKEEWDERCLEHYSRCKDEVRGGKWGSWGRKWGESQCQACWEHCRRIGQWPSEANEKPCPGL